MPKPAKNSVSVTARIHADLLMELDELVVERNKAKPGLTYTRTDALNEVIAVGLKAVDNPKVIDIGSFVLKYHDKLQDPKWVAEMKKNLEETSVVDVVATLNKDQLDVLAAITFDELRIRAGKRPFTFLDSDEKKKLLHGLDES